MLSGDVKIPTYQNPGCEPTNSAL